MLEQLLKQFPHDLQQQAETCFQLFEEKRVQLASSGQTSKAYNQAEYFEIIKVLSCSDFILQFLKRKPEWIFQALENRDYHSSKDLQDWQQQSQEIFQANLTLPLLSQYLRDFRNQQMIRIAWRDLAGSADLNESMFDLSQLADHCIKGSLSWLNEKQKLDFGTPVDSAGRELQMIVLGMGKLGAYELNFSSDIDLIFVYPEHGKTINAKRTTSNNEYFIKLGQQLIKLLNERTAHGYVFRVDMRLRPFGQSGPMAITIDAMENYFAAHGREWERYAMIKARMITGDEVDKKDLDQLLKSFIYRRYIDFGVFESLREMKGMIAHEVKQKRMEHNVKLGAGGIREIEFLAQAFQLLRGGRESELQERRVQKVIKILSEREIIPHYVADDLLEAYVFLRKTEHCLQEVNDQQTHLLPSNDYPKIRLAFAMGFESWEIFSSQLQQHRNKVQDNFSQLFQAPQIESEQTDSSSEKDNMSTLWNKNLHSMEEHQEDNNNDIALSLLESTGYVQSLEVLKLLQQFRASSNYRKMSSKGRERLDNLMPLILNALPGNNLAIDMQAVVLKRLLDVFETTCRRSVYLSLLIENPLALSQLVKLCSASTWIARELTRIPALLDELLDPRVLYTPLNKEHLAQDLAQRLGKVADDDLEQRMELMRHFKQTHSLRVAAADATGVLPIMKVSDYLTWIAETILEQVILTAWYDTAKKLGTPQYHPDHTPASTSEIQPGQGFAIIGFGKVGGLELGYSSDLDLVFVYDDGYEKGTTSGPKSAPNGLFFTRMGQRIMHILGTRTYSGILYECDMRLRPNGNSGLVATTLQTFKKYELEKAWLWEHQAICRARLVAGDSALNIPYTAVRKTVLAQPRDPIELRIQVREMRLKMRTALEKKKPGLFDVKQAAGGIVDIEFMVQYLSLQNAYHFPEIIKHTDNIRALESLLTYQVVDPTFSQVLIEIYQRYRDFMHAQALQESPALADDALFAQEREQICAYWQELMEN